MRTHLIDKLRGAGASLNAPGRLGIVVVFAALLNCGLLRIVQAQTQSEFLSGEGMPYAAFDRLQHTEIRIAGATLHVGFAPGDLALSKSDVLAWIEHSAKVVSRYYGRFPVTSARILIVPVDGSGVRGGTTWVIAVPRFVFWSAVVPAKTI